MNLNIDSLLVAQDDYFEKLEQNYQKEKQSKQSMKDYTIAMCTRIQKFIKQKQLKKRTKAIVKVQLWWKKYWNKIIKSRRSVQRVRQIIAQSRIFYLLQKIHKKNIVLRQLQTEWKRIKMLTFTKKDLEKIKFLQQYFSARYQMRKQYLKYLMKIVKTRVEASRILKKQAELSLRTSIYFREQLMTTISFENEIKFIDNTLAYNLITFSQKWDTYEGKLTKFMKGRSNKNENFIEQRNAFGESTWTNIKTMEQTKINPVEQNLQINLRKFKEQAESEFIESNQYLEQAREELVQLKQNYQKASTEQYYKKIVAMN